MLTHKVGVGAAALALALALVSTPATAAPKNAPPVSTSLTLLATTDVHGNINDWDYFKNAPYKDAKTGDTKGLASAASIVKAVRAEKGANKVVVVDNGDFLQGTPLDYYYAAKEPVTQTGLPHPMAVAYNTIGYDAQVVGNHEFNYGLGLLGAYVGAADFPVLGANVIDEATGKPYLKPYTIITKAVPGGKPVKIGVLGITNPGSAIWDAANVTGKVRFDDMVKTAATWVPVMKAKGADIVVVLAHGGVGGTSSYGGSLPVENPDDQIAAQVPGIDVVVVGHSHLDKPVQWVTNTATGKQVLLTQPKNFAQTVSEVDFTLTRAARTDSWTVSGLAETSLRDQTYPEDPAFTAALKPYDDKTLAYVSQVVAQSSQELPATESRYKDTAIMDFIQQVQTETVTKAMAGTTYTGLPVLSIAAPFSRTAVFPAGDVTIRDIAGLYIYDNTLQGVLMTGAQVKAYLEYSAKYFVGVPAGGTFDPATGTNAVIGGVSVPDYNYDIMAGVSYEIDLSQPVGSRIVNLHKADGTAVAASDQFVVAINNYRASGGGGFPATGKDAVVVYNQLQEIRQLLIDWASAKGVIDPADFYTQNWALTVAGVPVG